MTKTEQLRVVAQRLSDDQLDALLDFAQAMAEQPLHDKASPEAKASLERGLEQLARGETMSVKELDERLKAAAKSSDA